MARKYHQPTNFLSPTAGGAILRALKNTRDLTAIDLALVTKIEIGTIRTALIRLREEQRIEGRNGRFWLREE